MAEFPSQASGAEIETPAIAQDELKPPEGRKEAVEEKGKEKHPIRRIARMARISRLNRFHRRRM